MNTDSRSHVHSLIDRLSPVQLAALETIFRSMLDPLSLKLALAPLDDEPFTEEDRQAVTEADEWSKRNQPTPVEEVLADFGLTLTDWEAMAKTPLEESRARKRRSDQLFRVYCRDLSEPCEVGDVERNNRLDLVRFHHRDEAGIVDFGSHDAMVYNDLSPSPKDFARVRKNVKELLELVGVAIGKLDTEPQAVDLKRSGADVPKFRDVL
jgi:hypothetical protein